MISSSLFPYILISGALVAVASGLVGSFLILRRMALMSDALSHVALPGIALGVLFHFSPIWGGLAFLFFGILLIWLIEHKTKLATESVTGVLFVTALAIGAILIPEQDLLEAFFGSVQGITLAQSIIQGIVALGVIFFVLKYLKRLTLFSIAPDLSAAADKSSLFTEFILLALIAVTIAIGISFVGVLLISALAIIPAATARNLADTFIGFVLLSAVLAVFSLVSGLFIGNGYNVSPGIATVLVSATLFGLSLFKRN